jgi:hypothetical protein
LFKGSNGDSLVVDSTGVSFLELWAGDRLSKSIFPLTFKSIFGFSFRNHQFSHERNRKF